MIGRRMEEIEKGKENEKKEQEFSSIHRKEFSPLG
jgi:hypothetical protein